MNRYYEFGIKVAENNPYSDPGGGVQLAKDLGKLVGFGNNKAFKSPPVSKPPPVVAPPQPSRPVTQTVNVPAGSTGNSYQPTANYQPSSAIDNYFNWQLAAWPAAAALGKKAPAWLQGLAQYNPARSWSQLLLPSKGHFVSNQILRPISRMLPRDGGRGAISLLRSRLPVRAPAAGLKTLPTIGAVTLLNAGSELADAAGLLPTGLGGTGIGNLGWSDSNEFRQRTTPTNVWNPISYLGASANGWPTPVRSSINAGPIAQNQLLSHLRRNAEDWLKTRRQQQQRQTSQTNATPFTVEQMNQMAKNQGGFYKDRLLGHMMPTAAYFNQGTSPEDEIWRQRVIGASGASDWRPLR